MSADMPFVMGAADDASRAPEESFVSSVKRRRLEDRARKAQNERALDALKTDKYNADVEKHVARALGMLTMKDKEQVTGVVYNGLEDAMPDDARAGSTWHVMYNTLVYSDNPGALPFYEVLGESHAFLKTVTALSGKTISVPPNRTTGEIVWTEPSPVFLCNGKTLRGPFYIERVLRCIFDAVPPPHGLAVEVAVTTPQWLKVTATATED